MKTAPRPFARFGALAFLILAALPAAADNINPTVTNKISQKSRTEMIALFYPSCSCAEGTFVTNGCVAFAVAFGRTPLVAGAPVGRMEVFELTAARLPSGADVIRFDHPLMRRIVERDDARGLVSVEEGSGWIVAYRDGVPVGWSSGADLAIRLDPATGQWIEQLEDRTLVYYDADNAVDHIVTPAGVRLGWDNAGLDVVWDGNAIGQVWSRADGLMDVTKLSPSSFRVSWYPPAVAGEKENGRYAVSGNPAKTFTFSYSKVGAEHRYALREYRNEQFNFDYLWITKDGLDWTFVRDPDGLAVTDAESSTYAPGSTAVEGVRHATHIYSDASGSTIRRTTDYRYGLNGATIVRQSAGDDPVYWSAVRAETGPAAGRLVCVTNEYGGVTENAYDNHGRLVSETKTVFGNLLQVTTNIYSDVLADDFIDRRPRRVTETRNGVVTKDTSYDYGFSSDGGRRETIARIDPVSGAERIFVRDYYPVDVTNVAARGRVRFLSAEDGSATWYDYTAGANDSIVETATHGYRTAGGSFAILPSRSTRDITIYNFRGDAVRVEQYAHTGASFELTKWVNYAYNLPHKQIGYEDSTGFQESSDWICSGPIWQNLDDGTVVTNTFDKAKRIASMTKYTPFGTVEERFTRDAEDRIIAVDVYTNGVYFGSTSKSYDARGRIVRETDFAGRERGTSYSNDNRTVTTTAPGGAVTVHHLNPDGSTLVVSGNSNPYTTYERGVDVVSGLHWREIRTAQTAEAPSVLKNREWHNALGDLVRVDRGAPAGTTWTTLYNYDGKGFRIAEQDYSAAETNRNELLPLGPSTAYVYDSLGFRSSMSQNVNGEFRETVIAMKYIEQDGEVVELTVVTNLTSDASIPAIVEKTIKKLWPLTLSECSRIETTDVRGNVTVHRESFNRDVATKTIRTNVPASTNDAIKVYIAGKLVREIDSAGVLKQYGYDPLKRLISTTDGRGFVTIYQRDMIGQIVTMKAPDGAVTRNEYDSAGRLVAITDPNGNVSRYAYDASGNRVVQWGAEYPTFFAYDAYGRRIAMATTRDSSFAVDPANLPDLSEPSEELDITRWILDEASGLEMKRVYPDGTGPEYVYDTDGSLLRRTWVRGVVTDYNYNGWRQLVGKTFSDGTPNMHYSYDAMGRFSSATVDGVATNTFVYDVFGSALGENQFAGSLTNTWDRFGRLASLCWADGNSLAITYAENGRPAVLDIGQTALSFVDLPGTDMVGSLWSNDGFMWAREYGYRTLFPEMITNAWGESVLLESANLFDPGGRVSARHDLQGTNDWTTVLSYNGRSEIVSAIENGTTVFSKTYDPAGNRTDAAANALDQATANGVYDADGNLVSTTNGWFYVWDAENHLVLATNTMMSVEYAYDAFGRMVSRIVSKAGQTEKHNFLWDGETIIREMVSGNSPSDIVYVWSRPEQDASRSEKQVRELFAVQRNGAMFYPLHDASGAIRGYVDSQGNVVATYQYDPFGNERLSSGSLSDVFTFRYTDVARSSDTGLYEYLFRQYDGATGRWLSRDPVYEQGFLSVSAAHSRANAFFTSCKLVQFLEGVAARFQNRFPQSNFGLIVRYKLTHLLSKRIYFSYGEIRSGFDYKYLKNNPQLFLERWGLDEVCASSNGSQMDTKINNQIIGFFPHPREDQLQLIALLLGRVGDSSEGTSADTDDPPSFSPINNCCNTNVVISSSPERLSQVDRFRPQEDTPYRLEYLPEQHFWSGWDIISRPLPGLQTPPCLGEWRISLYGDLRFREDSTKPEIIVGIGLGIGKAATTDNSLP